MENSPLINSAPVQDSPIRKVVYGMYIANLVAIMLPLLPVVSVIIAYIFQDDADENLKTHFRFLIRTFWLAVLYFGISSLLVFVIVGIILLPICMIWWIVRNVIGLKALMQDKPIRNPKSWGF